MNQPVPDQWFAVLPDGQQLGPCPWQQILTAVQTGQLGTDTLVRRADWLVGCPCGEILNQLGTFNQSPRPPEHPTHSAGESVQVSPLPFSPSPIPAQQETPPPSSFPTYREQLASNPLRTLFFGPRMDPYRPDQRAATKRDREHHFLKWVILLVGWITAGMILPPVAAFLRNGSEQAMIVLLGVLVYGLVPVLLYLLAMLTYAGSLFEWQIFMKSKRARDARSIFGDTNARKYYLLLSGIVMLAITVFAVGGMALLTIGLLLQNPG